MVPETPLINNQILTNLCFTVADESLDRKARDVGLKDVWSDYICILKPMWVNPRRDRDIALVGYNSSHEQWPQHQWQIDGHHSVKYLEIHYHFANQIQK